MQVLGCISCTQQAPTVPASALPYQHCIVEFIMAELTSSSEGSMCWAWYVNAWTWRTTSLPVLCSSVFVVFSCRLWASSLLVRHHWLKWHCDRSILALWAMAGFFRRVQVRRLGSQFLLCLVNSLLLAHQHLCDATDAQCRHFLLASNLRETTDNLMAQSFLFL